MGDRPTTRAEQQEQTRRALVLAARETFARDGFHGARLERIAALAGYSKGAVYSNFDSKAALFLAVLDLNLETVDHELGEWAEGAQDDASAEAPDGKAAGGEAPGDAPDDAAPDAELAEVMSGFALASLEFIAVAVRDDELRAGLGERIQALVAGYYQPYAIEHRSDGDVLDPAELALLLAAFDQGAARRSLSGTAAMNQRLLRTGLARLVEAGRLGDLGPEVSGVADAEHDDEPAMHRPDLQRRIAETLRD